MALAKGLAVAVGCTLVVAGIFSLPLWVRAAAIALGGLYVLYEYVESRRLFIGYIALIAIVGVIIWDSRQPGCEVNPAPCEERADNRTY